MFKMFKGDKPATTMATSSQGPGGTQQGLEDDSQRPEDCDSQNTDNDSQGLENIPSDFPEDEFDPAEG
ncbi:hypothetical protein QJS04_geneDACA024660 [Acorus gramineus]|uniref:Uncharacterized protein n=1 Tax=Acorus gramineus TaxID=55184 RepID=A0AAV9BXH3_ACOGR|nr:hypothetical protein QJS04_geneDACA024660 [Acorus gramineus]